MRRSFRDALVGFSIIGGIVLFGGSMLWLRGVRLNSRSWSIKANFSDASGLAERSPVVYRGILIGSVSEITIKPDTVQATLEIDKSDLRLTNPVIAKVVKSSLLGGDVQVALESKGDPLQVNAPMPQAENCSGQGVLCRGDVIDGLSLTSISSLTAAIEKLISSAENEGMVTHLVDSTKQFDRTQKELEDLILQAKLEMNRVQPIISEITQASIHIKNILAAIDNPTTLNDIQETASSTRSLTKQIDSIGEEVNKMMNDEELMNAVRNVTIGLGELFNELYPPKTQSSYR